MTTSKIYIIAFVQNFNLKPLKKQITIKILGHILGTEKRWVKLLEYFQNALKKASWPRGKGLEILKVSK